MGATIERVRTSGVFSLDGEDFAVENNVWLVGDQHEAGDLINGQGWNFVRSCTTTYNPSMGSSYTVSEARAQLPALLDLVARGEEITVTRHGRPAVILIHPDRWPRSRAATVLDEADRLRDEIAQLSHEPMPAPIEDVDADARIAQLRADRAAR